MPVYLYIDDNSKRMVSEYYSPINSFQLTKDNAMHELSIATAIIELAESKLSNPATLSKVAVINSSLSGISAESLSFCFDELCKIKGYTHAKLEITTASIQMKCLHCGKEYQCITLDTFCPVCGKPERDILTVPPFKIDYIETAEHLNV